MKQKIYKDLEEGNNVENELVKILENSGLKVTTTQVDGLNSKYDLIVNTIKKTYTIEVKFDRMVNETGNVAIELHKILNDEKLPSGLSITEADYYVYKLSDKFYSIKTKKLKDLIKKLIKNDAIKIVMGGDNRSVCIGLISKYIFKKHCKEIKNE